MTDYPRPIGPRWYGCGPGESECDTCGRIRPIEELVYVSDPPWIECLERDDNGECAQADGNPSAH